MRKRDDSKQNREKEVSLETTISEESKEGKNVKTNFKGKGGFRGRG